MRVEELVDVVPLKNMIISSEEFGGVLHIRLQIFGNKQVHESRRNMKIRRVNCLDGLREFVSEMSKELYTHFVRSNDTINFYASKSIIGSDDELQFLEEYLDEKSKELIDF